MNYCAVLFGAESEDTCEDFDRVKLVQSHLQSFPIDLSKAVSLLHN